jgi:hypothetical protein
LNEPIDFFVFLALLAAWWVFGCIVVGTLEVLIDGELTFFDTPEGGAFLPAIWPLCVGAVVLVGVVFLILACFYWIFGYPE